MTKACVVCGKTFDLIYARQLTCSKECSKIRHDQKAAEYETKKRDISKRKKSDQLKKQNNIVAIGYAERQIAQTLAIVPKIDVTI